MYEDKTYENIMADMMESVPDGIDNQEGSLVYLACTKMAALGEDIYEAIAEASDNMMVDSADLEHLIQLGSMMGIPIIGATNAVFKAQFNIAFEIGDEFEHTEQDLTYVVTELIDNDQHIYKVENVDGGTEANAYLGDIEPDEFKDGFETGKLLELLTPGKDEEDEEDYRFRLLNSTDARAYAGNRAYYLQEVGEIQGVGSVIASRVTATDHNVEILFLDDKGGIPSPELVAQVQKIVDPTLDGEGYGLAPIGAKVKVLTPVADALGVTATIQMEPGKELSDIKAQLDAAVTSYFAELAGNWDDSASGLVVRIAKIESKLIDVPGVVDISNLKIAGTAGNKTLEPYHIPVKGDFVWS